MWTWEKRRRGEIFSGGKGEFFVVEKSADACLWGQISFFISSFFFFLLAKQGNVGVVFIMASNSLLNKKDDGRLNCESHRPGLGWGGLGWVGLDWIGSCRVELGQIRSCRDIFRIK